MNNEAILRTLRGGSFVRHVPPRTPLTMVLLIPTFRCPLQISLYYRANNAVTSPFSSTDRPGRHVQKSQNIFHQTCAEECKEAFTVPKCSLQK